MTTTQSKTRSLIVRALRRVSGKMSERNIGTLFPSLIPRGIELDAYPPSELQRVKNIESTVRIVLDGGTVTGSELAALVHYIADMSEE